MMKVDPVSWVCIQPEGERCFCLNIL